MGKSNRRAGCSSWRRAISYPNRLSNYIVGALHLKRYSRQDPDAREPQGAVAAAAIASAAVATAAVTAVEISPPRPRQGDDASTPIVCQSERHPAGATLNNAIPNGELVARDLNVEEIEAAIRQWPFSASNSELFIFGEIKLTRGQANKCMLLALGLVNVVQKAAIDRRLGRSESIEYVLIARKNVHDLLETLLSFIDDPRDRMTIQNQLNKGNIFINSKRNYELQCERRKNLRRSVWPTMLERPHVPHAQRVNRAQPGEGESSGQRREVSPFFKWKQFDRTKAAQNATGRQPTIVECEEAIDGDANEAPREGTSEQTRNSFKDRRFQTQLATFTLNCQELGRQTIKLSPYIGRSKDAILLVSGPSSGSTSCAAQNSNDASKNTPSIRAHLQEFHYNVDSFQDSNNRGYAEHHNEVGGERAQTDEPSNSRITMGVVDKTLSAVSSTLDNVRHGETHKNDTVAPDSDSESAKLVVVNSERQLGPQEAGFSGSSDFEAVELNRAEHVKNEEIFGQIQDDSRTKVSSWLENLTKKPTAKMEVVPAKPVCPRSLSVQENLRHHEAAVVKRSLSTSKTQTQPMCIPENRISFEAMSDPPSPERSAQLKQSNSARSNDGAMSSEPQPSEAGQSANGLNFPITSANSFRPIQPASPGSTEASLSALKSNGVARTGLAPPPPHPPPRSPRALTSANRNSTSPCLRRRRYQLAARRPGTPPPPPHAASSSSVSDDWPGQARQQDDRPNGTLSLSEDNGPDQQNTTAEEGSVLSWKFMDDNILLQHNTIPSPTTYKLPE